MNPEVIKEADRLIEAHRKYSYFSTFRKETETENAIQSAIISATTSREATGNLNPNWKFYNDVIFHLQSKLK